MIECNFCLVFAIFQGRPTKLSCRKVQKRIGIVKEGIFQLFFPLFHGTAALSNDLSKIVFPQTIWSKWNITLLPVVL